MVTLLLAQLWWIMPIIITLVYLTCGWFITNALVKRGTIEDTSSYLFVLLLWLPVFILTGLWHILKWLLMLPKRFAERQLEKHSK
ncbi:hypothetical protein BI049_gp088 [Salmonella phage vB_SnwM_CGG4-1]|uniref:Uncharacterized protein n=1 Tax=Salmonella phage vB_SnwM_CGG4-1 TaxID=1815631 RepID=A0A1B0VV36_9CAUD|nr:hypothetical protein BI049_gp088 [Salmonella phage vB_SnwM_CGG4-1]ANA49442.1 hypothetical protein CGG41_087A [Salmonella phage vB_SnwM_CGG4-1]